MRQSNHAMALLLKRLGARYDQLSDECFTLTRTVLEQIFTPQLREQDGIFNDGGGFSSLRLFDTTSSNACTIVEEPSDPEVELMTERMDVSSEV